MTTLMKDFSQSSYWFPIFVSHEVAYIVYKEFSTNRNNFWSVPAAIYLYIDLCTIQQGENYCYYSSDNTNEMNK